VLQISLRKVYAMINAVAQVGSAQDLLRTLCLHQSLWLFAGQNPDDKSSRHLFVVGAGHNLSIGPKAQEAMFEHWFKVGWSHSFPACLTARSRLICRRTALTAAGPRTAAS
jgi:hypothetical protein